MDAPDLIVCDLNMPFATGANNAHYVTSFEVGVRTVHELAWVYPNTPVVAMTSLDEVDIDKIKLYLSPIPTYQKPQNWKRMIELVSCYLVSQDFGGVQ
jgi:CheY-like chemotaxis protein